MSRRWIPLPGIKGWIARYRGLAEDRLATVVDLLFRRAPDGFRLGAPIPPNWRPQAMTALAACYMRKQPDGAALLDFEEIERRDSAMRAAAFLLGQGETSPGMALILGVSRTNFEKLLVMHPHRVLLEATIELIDAEIAKDAALTKFLAAPPIPPAASIPAESAAPTPSYLRDGLPPSDRWLRERTAAPDTATAPGAVGSVAMPPAATDPAAAPPANEDPALSDGDAQPAKDLEPPHPPANPVEAAGDKTDEPGLPPEFPAEFAQDPRVTAAFFAMWRYAAEVVKQHGKPPTRDVAARKTRRLTGFAVRRGRGLYRYLPGHLRNAARSRGS